MFQVKICVRSFEVLLSGMEGENKTLWGSYLLTNFPVLIINDVETAFAKQKVLAVIIILNIPIASCIEDTKIPFCYNTKPRKYYLVNK